MNTCKVVALTSTVGFSEAEDSSDLLAAGNDDGATEGVIDEVTVSIVAVVGVVAVVAVSMLIARKVRSLSKAPAEIQRV